MFAGYIMSSDRRSLGFGDSPRSLEPLGSTQVARLACRPMGACGRYKFAVIANLRRLRHIFDNSQRVLILAFSAKSILVCNVRLGN